MDRFIKIKKRIPYWLKYFFKKLKFRGKEYYCNVCKSDLSHFNDGGANYSIFNEMNIVGGGFKEHDSCPVCYASFRQRSTQLYLDNDYKLTKNIKLLHVAPEACFHNEFKSKLGKNYICGDIEPERYTHYAKPIYVDLLEPPFKDDHFDMVIASHILEHIEDDLHAMREVYRILKQGGTAILQVPISMKLEQTYENDTIISEADRIQHYGQKDHVRLYAMDYVDRLNKAGFKVEVIDLNKYSSTPNFNKLMIDKREPLFICHKLHT